MVALELDPAYTDIPGETGPFGKVVRTFLYNLFGREDIRVLSVAGENFVGADDGEELTVDKKLKHYFPIVINEALRFVAHAAAASTLLTDLDKDVLSAKFVKVMTSVVNGIDQGWLGEAHRKSTKGQWKHTASAELDELATSEPVVAKMLAVAILSTIRIRQRDDDFPVGLAWFVSGQAYGIFLQSAPEFLEVDFLPYDEVAEYTHNDGTVVDKAVYGDMPFFSFDTVGVGGSTSPLALSTSISFYQINENTRDGMFLCELNASSFTPRRCSSTTSAGGSRA